MWSSVVFGMWMSGPVQTDSEMVLWGGGSTVASRLLLADRNISPKRKAVMDHAGMNNSFCTVLHEQSSFHSYKGIKAT